MSGKTIVFGTIMLAAGGILGFISGYEVARRKFEVVEDDEEEEETEEEVKDTTPEVKQDVEVKDEKEKESKDEDKTVAYDNYHDYTQYSKDEDDDEEDEDEEDDDTPFYEKDLLADDPEMLREFYEDHKATDIFLINRDDYDNAYVKPSSWEVRELWYFPQDDELVDEDNNDVTNQEEYVGTTFSKIRFRSSLDEQTFVRNMPLKTDFWVHKCLESSREDVFRY